MCHILFNITNNHTILLIFYCLVIRVRPRWDPSAPQILAHFYPLGNNAHIVFYKMGLIKMFDVMSNFQHKSDHTVQISHFSHTGQAHTRPSFSPSNWPTATPWPSSAKQTHLVLFRNITSIIIIIDCGRDVN